MKTERMLQIQSLVDGRLSAGENAEIEKLVASDADARALAQELRMTKAMFTGCEPEMRMPESREFFWSKIEREIQRQDLAAADVEEPAMQRNIAQCDFLGFAIRQYLQA